MLCRVCETKLSKYEKYTKLDFYDKIKESSQTIGEILKATKLKYNTLKLFQLSIIWRASVSSNKMFQNVILGPHEEKIRLMLINENPGRFFEYCCITNILLRGKLYCDDLILSIEHRRWDRHRVYMFVFGGLVWIYVISSHTNQFIFKHYFLQENGELILVKRDIREIEYIMNSYEDMYKQGKLNIQ